MTPQEKLRQLDKQLKANMIGMKPLHHTSGDWDFANANWILDGATFVSAPSSLHFTAVGNDALLKPTTVPIANLKEGRIITYVRAQVLNVRSEIVFRYQDVNNYYCLNWCSGVAFTNRIYRVQGGVQTILRQAFIAWLPALAWRRCRITWWNDFVGLVIRTEYWDGSAWQTIVTDAFDALNLWKDIGGRVGLGDFAIAGSACQLSWLDDTFIYGIPP